MMALKRKLVYLQKLEQSELMSFHQKWNLWWLILRQTPIRLKIENLQK